MKNEKSCGAIIFRDGKVLLVHQLNNFWSFPKGHVEGNESEIETAERETEEETGLDVEIDPTKRFSLNYFIPKLRVNKTIVLFFARVLDDTNFVRQEAEIAEMRWVPISEVKKYFKYKAWKKVWEEVLKELNKKEQK